MLNRLHAVFLIAFFLFHLSAFAQEICNNAIDDDLDGLIDLNDTSDCICGQVGISPVSLIPNPSFEDNNCLPQGPGELSCAVGWQQATAATTDYFMFAPNGFYLPNTPFPIPDGAGFTGFVIMDSFPYESVDTTLLVPYLEYLGTCLNAPMQAGVTYRLKMSIACSYVSYLQNTDTSSSLATPLGPIELSIFGSAACDSFPVAVPLFGCPIGVDDWMLLDTVIYQPNGDWLTVNFEFTPTTTIQSVIIGGPCDLPDDYLYSPTYDFPYFLADNLVLNRTSLFSSVRDTGSICRNTLYLSFPADSLVVNYQWYFNGVAIPGENDTVLQASTLGLGAGIYQMRTILLDGNCKVYTRDIDAPLAIVPQISSSINLGCPPLSVQFTNDAGSDIDSCFWDFGDGNTSTQFNPLHTYTQVGNYHVTLRVKRNDGCFFESTFVNAIRVLVEAGAPLSVTGGLCTSTLSIFGGSNFPEPSYQWLFNGNAIPGQTGSLLNASSLGYGEGTYRLLVNNPNGRCEASEIVVTPSEQLMPLAGVERNTGCAPFSVRFTNLTQGNVGACSWDFGNGSVSSDCDPLVTYPDTGKYSVLLRVVSAEGCGFDSIYTDFIRSVLCRDSSGVIVQPNVFTPNDDGTNEYFSLITENLSYLKLSIYDRWGILMFDKASGNLKDDNPTWNALNKGSKAPSGVYYYLYTAKDITGKVLEGNGFFHLLGQ